MTTADQPPSSAGSAAATPNQSGPVVLSLSRQSSESQGVKENSEGAPPKVDNNHVLISPPTVSETAPSTMTNGTIPVNQKSLSTILSERNQVEQRSQSPSYKDRAKGETGGTPPQTPGERQAPRRKTSGNPPPPPVRICSTLTRPTTERTESISLQGSPQLDNRPRKTSLPSSPLTDRKNGGIARSKSIKVQATILQELLTGKASQSSDNDDPQKSGSDSSSPASSRGAPPPTASKPVASTGVPQPQDLAAAIAAVQLKSGNASPSLSQNSTEEESSMPKLDLSQQKLVEGVSKGKESIEETAPEPTEDGIATQSDYKPRLQLIKAQVAERRRLEAQLGNSSETKTAEEQPSSVTKPLSEPKQHSSSKTPSEFSVHPVGVPVEPSPIVFPPMVPPKPKPVKVPQPAIPVKSKEDEGPPLPPPLKKEDVMALDNGLDEEEPPPLPARTPAMLEEASPKKVAKKPNYTNISLVSANNTKEVITLPPPPPPITNKKESSKKKTSNYPRTVIKKLYKKERTPEPTTGKKTKTKDKESTSPVGSPTKKSKDSPTRKSPTRKSPAKKDKNIKGSNAESATNKSHPTDGPAGVRKPMFMNMSKRPLPQIPGERKSDDDEPEHTADDYEQFDLGMIPPMTSYYANYGPNGIQPVENKPLTSRMTAGIQRAHSFNPGDRSTERSNFDPIPTPAGVSRRSVGMVSGTHADYIEGYVNTSLNSTLPMRGRPLPQAPDDKAAKKKSSEGDNLDYDYPHRRNFIMAHTLPTRGKNAQGLSSKHPGDGASRAWGNDGYPKIQQRQNVSRSESVDADTSDCLDPDYVPMASIGLTMDDSYINWETIGDMNRADLSERQKQLLPKQPTAQQGVPPRQVQGRAVPLNDHADDNMDTDYVNLPQECLRPKQPLFQGGQQPAHGFSATPHPLTVSPFPSLKPTELPSTRHETMAPPSPRPKPAKSRQRSATDAASLDQDLSASIASGPPHHGAPSFLHSVAPGLPHPGLVHPVAPRPLHPVAPGLSNRGAPGLSHPVAPGLSHPVARGLSHPVAPGLSHPVAPGLSHPVAPGLSHRGAPGLSHPVAPGLSHPSAPGLSHPVAPGLFHPVAPEQRWQMMQPSASPHDMGQFSAESSVYQNIDVSASLPTSFGHHARLNDSHNEMRRVSDGVVIKPTTAALPPRNIPRKPH